MIPPAAARHALLALLTACAAARPEASEPREVTIAPAPAAIASAAPPAADPGEALFQGAYELEQKGDRDGALARYRAILDTAPGSKYAANAWVAIGDRLFDDAAGDASKWPLAQQAYEKASGYDSPVASYALYKLSYTLWNQGQSAAALSAMARCIGSAARSAAPTAKPLVRSARKDIIALYATAGDPRKAYAFFQPLSGDAAGANDATLAMVHELARQLLDMARYADGLAAAAELAAHAGRRYCAEVARVAQDVRAATGVGGDPTLLAAAAKLAADDAKRCGP